MRLEHDQIGDIVYVHIGSDAAVDHTERVGETDEYQRGIDYDAQRQILGCEFMNAPRGLDLDTLPHRDQIAAFITSMTGLRVIQKAS